jgi:hypothetical protein
VCSRSVASIGRARRRLGTSRSDSMAVPRRRRRSLRRAAALGCASWPRSCANAPLDVVGQRTPRAVQVGPETISGPRSPRYRGSRTSLLQSPLSARSMPPLMVPGHGCVYFLHQIVDSEHFPSFFSPPTRRRACWRHWHQHVPARTRVAGLRDRSQPEAEFSHDRDNIDGRVQRDCGAG